MAVDAFLTRFATEHVDSRATAETALTKYARVARRDRRTDFVERFDFRALRDFIAAGTHFDVPTAAQAVFENHERDPIPVADGSPVVTPVFMAYAPENEHDMAANQAIAVLQPGSSCVGGILRDGVSVYAGPDAEDRPGWLIVLAVRPDGAKSNPFASKIVFEMLFRLETFSHKIRLQERRLAPIRTVLEANESGLGMAIEELARATNALSASAGEREHRASLRAAYDLTRCRRDVRVTADDLRYAATALRANRENMEQAFRDFGDYRFHLAFHARFEAVDRALGQCETGIGFAQPLLDRAEDELRQHERTLLMELNVSELKENARREKEDGTRNQLTFLLAFVGIILAMIQIVEAFMQVYASAATPESLQGVETIQANYRIMTAPYRTTLYMLIVVAVGVLVAMVGIARPWEKKWFPKFLNSR
jgi:hypothetical protein